MAQDNSLKDNRFLSFFDDDSQKANEKYLRFRQKLIVYFSVNRCKDSANLTDESILRAMNSLSDESKQLTVPIEAYIRGVANNILHEEWRRNKNLVSLEEIPPTKEPSTNPQDDDISTQKNEEKILCQKKCLKESLTDSDRDLIIKYCFTKEGEKRKEVRDKLANELNIPNTKLRKKVLRIRDKLKECLEKCLDVEKKLAFDGTKFKNPHI